jgi:hypothetical protein
MIREEEPTAAQALARSDQEDVMSELITPADRAASQSDKSFWTQKLQRVGDVVNSLSVRAKIDVGVIR